MGTKDLKNSIIEKYMKLAYKYYEKNHPNICTDAEDIAGCVYDFMGDDGLDPDYDHIYKYIAGEEDEEI